MKAKLFYTVFVCLAITPMARAQITDIPTPTSNLQLLPAGSYVIAMDNSLQVNSSGNFNMKAYGLIFHLLNNNVHLQWCIRAGKAKDDIDFTASADQIKPTLTSGGTTRNFKAGPLVIFASDTTGVAALIESFYSGNSLTGLNRPQVYRLTASASGVDIRYDLNAFHPKAGILTDGGNQNIHLAYMTACSIPAENYATSQGTDLATSCFTFASEPHNTNSGTAVNNAISAIRDFVYKGGNFLAQCEAVNNYENNSLGRFQTTLGITTSNSNIGTSLIYDNPDLSFSQYEGAFNGSSGGSLKNWKVVGSTINYMHAHATGTGTNTTVIGASVSKHYYGKGGMVFYIGNHSFTTSSSTGINGMRMYMNAFLTPTNTNCPALIYYTLPVRLLNFSSAVAASNVILKWKIAGNEEVKSFSLENSNDGIRFPDSVFLLPTATLGDQSYQLQVPPFMRGGFFRLKIEDRQGRRIYSTVMRLEPGGNDLIVLTNPIRDVLQIRYSAAKTSKLNLCLYNASGTLLFRQTYSCVQGTNGFTVPAVYYRQKGLSILEAIDSEGNRSITKLIR